MNISICMKYRRKPVVIDAIQWTGDNYHEVFEFTEGNFYPTKSHSDTLALSSNDNVKGRRATISSVSHPERTVFAKRRHLTRYTNQ